MTVELYGPLAAGNEITTDGYNQWVQAMETLHRRDPSEFWSVLFKSTLGVSEIPSKPDDGPEVIVTPTLARHAVVTDVNSPGSIISRVYRRTAIHELRENRTPDPRAANVLVRDVKNATKAKRISDRLSELRDKREIEE